MGDIGLSHMDFRRRTLLEELMGKALRHKGAWARPRTTGSPAVWSRLSKQEGQSRDGMVWRKQKGRRVSPTTKREPP